MTRHLEGLSLKGQRGAGFIQQKDLRGPPPPRGAPPGRSLLEKNLTPRPIAHTIEHIAERRNPMQLAVRNFPQGRLLSRHPKFPMSNQLSR